jgi:Ferritin-like domain
MRNPTELSSQDSNPPLAVSHDTASQTTCFSPPHRLARRSFIRSLGISAALLVPGAALLGATREALDQAVADDSPSVVTQGDVAILRFLAAAELLEQDLWQQYSELAEGNPAFGDALAVLDEDMNQYIFDNTDDELSHADFLNAFLSSVGAQPVNLDAFRTLPSSQATGAQQIGRLTNLMNLTVDTSWWIRYRSTDNLDFGATFPQFIDIVNRPAIPLQDLPVGSDEAQAIANTAAFHFGTIEQGGTSLYPALALRVSDLIVLKILLGIGGSEVNHFAIWHDKAGNAPEVSVPGVSFPDMKSFEGDELRQKNLIMPEPCKFINAQLPQCSVIRPSTAQRQGANAAFAGLRSSGLFAGQSNNFFTTMNDLARAADSSFRS